MKNLHQKVVIALSGGVDSSVAAALLAKQGYEVIGIMMRLWSIIESGDSNSCYTLEAITHAQRVADLLKIPFYVLDAQEEFRKTVIEYFISGYSNNITPNPCLICNREIRWSYLYNYAMDLGADALATGHYVRLRENLNGKIELLRGLDYKKDQSYILHFLDQKKLANAIFPVGEYLKSHVREIARENNLPVANLADSQDLCFLGGGDYRNFLTRHTPHLIQPGPILNNNGDTIGQHSGLAYYTIGQRKGLRINSSVPLYVIRKIVDQNALIVGPNDALGQAELTAKNVNWISGEDPSRAFRAQVKIRYKSTQEWAEISSLGEGRIHVQFDRPLRDITPGQAVVLYDKDICLGGGLIE